MSNCSFWFFTLLCICCQSQTFTLNGNASNLGGGCYRLTSSSSYQVGSAWSQDAVDLSQPFDLRLDVKFGDSDGGADGIAFVLQSQNLNAIGAVGSSIGYAVNAPADPVANGIVPSLAIEFDTFWDGSGGDPNFDHIAFMRDGIKDHTIAANTVAAPVEALAGGQNIEDGNYHRVQVTWNPAIQLLAVYLDCDLRLSATVDLQNDVFSNGNPVYWGFTGSTGGLTNAHQFCVVQPTVINVNSASNEVFICPGSSGNLGVTVQSPGTIQWTPSTGLSSTVIQSPTASPSVNTTYTITSTDICGEVTTESVNVIIVDPPTVFAGDNLEFCENTVTTTTATASEIGSFNWSTSNGNIVGVSDNATVDVNAGGTYSVEFTSNLSGCSATDDVLISELPMPVFIPSNPYLICPEEALNLSVGNNWDDLVWPDGSSAFDYEVTAPGTYTVLITDNGCSNSIDLQVEYPVLTPPVLGADVSICNGETAHLSAGIPGVWSNGQSAVAIDVPSPGEYFITIVDQGCILSDTIEVFMFLPPPVELGDDIEICTGDTAHFEIFAYALWPNGNVGLTYQTAEEGVVYVTATNGPCVVRDSATVELLDIPYVDIIGDSVLCNGNQIFLSVNADHYSFLRWSTGDTAKIISVESEQSISVVVTSTCGSDLDRMDIAVEDCDNAIYIPNAFTPNGDGINDVLFISAINVEQFKIDIFDRWGRMIFHSDELESNWQGGVMDGDYYVPDGIYHYHYLATLKNLEQLEGNGFVTLSR